MKNLGLNILGIVLLSVGLLAFTKARTGGIQGKVNPAEAAVQVLAVSGKDTLTTMVNGGTFVFSNVKAGTYSVMVKAVVPYKDVTLSNVAVVDSATTDVGVIRLLQ
ncbi:hypothetical protein PBAL39_10581 [Pedobacter sp. BAL39]|uniref:carboxypeptidase regulatory-like domain-containing protein n=1 Tax=Pedobacter sp. BAL39 TaxID=391596 RepID=UPI00015597F1|nr:carboxypeptidase regulatory-like domain-containing protein [Pedobacter sp. BAL39]EDM37584.1 hypothetical protein PBAL39_10581 [Pedobacter sp. BAL39]